ncbi:Opioid growth factor receptor (OGFr) conserved domain-containing protein [Entamoeba marina]
MSHSPPPSNEMKDNSLQNYINVNEELSKSTQMNETNESVEKDINVPNQPSNAIVNIDGLDNINNDQKQRNESNEDLTEDLSEDSTSIKKKEITEEQKEEKTFAVPSEDIEENAYDYLKDSTYVLNLLEEFEEGKDDKSEGKEVDEKCMEEEEKDIKEMKNYFFYLNQFGGIPPRKVDIQDKTIILNRQSNGKWGAEDFYQSLIHCKEEDRYIILENRHDFIQWIFPTFVTSMANGNSFKLQKRRSRKIRKSQIASLRFVKFYRMFLNFLGADLINLQTGEVGVLPNKEIRKERHENFNYSGHNYLRITRLFNSLHAFGFQPYMDPLFQYFTDNFSSFKNCYHSLKYYWQPAAKADRKIHHEPRDLEYYDSVFLKKVDDLTKGKGGVGEIDDVIRMIEEDWGKEQ